MKKLKLKKVTIGGHEFNVVNENEAELCDVVVVMRVADKPIPEFPSSIVPCALCGVRCWVTNASPKNPPRWCLQCAVEKVHALDPLAKL